MKKIRYSKPEDILLIELSGKTIEHAEDDGQVIIHFTSDDEPVLIEILGAKEFLMGTLESVVNEKEVSLP